MTTLPRRERPLVGITADTATGPSPWHRLPHEPVVFLPERYTQALVACGALPLILPPLSARTAIRALLEQLDGIVISGGNFDIDPKFYGEEPRASLGEIKDERTQFELELVSLGIEQDMPMLGICGGEQAINVALGGSLYQDIRGQVPHARAHELGALRESGGHLIKVRAGTKLRAILAREFLEVNTTHHQSIKALGRGLIASAVSDDGVIEGIESEDHSFVIGVQWHPELLTHKEPAQQKLFAAFVSACRAVRRP